MKTPSIGPQNTQSKPQTPLNLGYYKRILNQRINDTVIRKATELVTTLESIEKEQTRIKSLISSDQTLSADDLKTISASLSTINVLSRYASK